MVALNKSITRASFKQYVCCVNDELLFLIVLLVALVSIVVFVLVALISRFSCVKQRNKYILRKAVRELVVVVNIFKSDQRLV